MEGLDGCGGEGELRVVIVCFLLYDMLPTYLPGNKIVEGAGGGGLLETA